jgi:hypothetical protein
MIRRIFRNLYFLTFLNGFLIATLFYFSMEANYEKQLFRAIQLNIDEKMSPKDVKDSLLVKVMHESNALLANRSQIFSALPIEGFKADFHPATVDLMTANGACGSYALVLSRILQNYDYTVRIAQMKANGRFAAHNVVEAKTKDGWVVMDPLYDVYFIKPDGKSLASYADVQKNWAFYSKQLPPNYNHDYRYEDVRYCNWNKIPLLMPAIKKVLDLTMGKQKADEISFRANFLKKYDLFFFIVLFLYIPLFLVTLKKLIQTKIFPQPNIPITFSNVLRYLRLRYSGRHLESSVNS